ncbi:MAG TPA: DoxX family protein [Acidobacteriaceae bacterium]|jgi:putative oxidoreductase|nr:DoxX family protein [Acidobacteriaceae bacterium]
MNAPTTAIADKKPSGLTARLYRRYQLASAMLESPFLLVIRVFWGWQFAQSGWGRLHHLDTATGFFASLGVPAPHFTVICVSLLELIGGILLIAGLATRFIGLLLAGDMVVAYLLSDHEAIRSLFSSDPTRFYTADPFTFLYAALIALVFGAGRYSVDYLIWRRQGC